MPELIVKLDDTILQICRFDDELLRIGRSRENDVVIENLSVSRHHGQVRLYEGRYILTDMNSSNGILVNGTRVTKVDLADNDVITIGKHKLIFQMVPGDSPTMLDEPPPALPVIARRPAPAEAKAEAWLKIESGRLKDREFQITRFETSLGKAPTNDVVLTDDWLLGKKQAIILRKGNFGFEVQDLGGLRRVKVNGNIVTDRTDLKNDDVLELGGTRMVFHTAALPPKDKGGATSPVTPKSPFPAPAIHDEPAKAAVHVNDNESLDLEDFSHWHPPADNVSQPSVAPALGIDAATPEVVKPNPAPPARPFVSPASSNGSTGDNPPRKNSRGKRHQRAAQAAAAAQSKVTTVQPSPTVAPAKSTSTVTPAESPANSTADEKEIEIWEQALQNGSPAIRRQAVRTLKKLTGRDYEA